MVNELGWVLHKHHVGARLNINERQLRIWLLLALQVNLVTVVGLIVQVCIIRRIGQGPRLVIFEQGFGLLFFDLVDFVLGTFHLIQI